MDDLTKTTPRRPPRPPGPEEASGDEALSLSPPDLAGRGSEEEKLAALVEHVRTAGRGSAVLLAGDSGVGKTALAEWCLAIAQAQGSEWVRATCEPFHAGMSFFPIQEIIRRLAGPRSTVQGLVSTGFGSTSNEYRTACAAFDEELDPALRRESMMATFANAVIAKTLATKRPLAIFLDDAERIDTPSVDALTVLLSRIEEAPVLLVVAFRSDVVAGRRDHNFRPILERARRGLSSTQIIDVGTVAGDDFIALVTGFLGGADNVPELFIRQLFRETEGNPLHVREIIRSLLRPQVDGGPPLIEEREDGRWWFGNTPNLWDLPSSIEDAIAVRLEPLDARERATLETAAVVGRRCHFQTLAALTEFSEDELIVVVDALETQDLLGEVSSDPDSIEFTHRKVHDVVYNQIVGLRRRRLHARVAEVLEDERDEIPQDEWEIAVGWHLYQARKYDAASPHLIRAGQRSLAEQAGQVASEHFRQALDALEKSNAPDPRKIADTRLMLGESLKVASQLDAAFRELDIVARGDESPSARRWAFNHIGDIHKLRNHIPAALSAYDRCEILARDENDRALIAEVAADLAELHMREAERLAGLSPEASELHAKEYKRYLDIETESVDESSSREARSRSFRNRAKYARVNGHLSDSIDLYEKSIEFLDHGIASHQFLIPYAKALRLVGRVEDAELQVDSVLEWSRQIGALRSEAVARQYKGLLLLEGAIKLDGSARVLKLEQAASQLEWALKLHEESSFNQGFRETCVDLFEASLQAGDLAKGIDYLRKANESGNGPGSWVGVNESEDVIQDDASLARAFLAQVGANGEGDRVSRIRSRLQELNFDLNSGNGTK